MKITGIFNQYGYNILDKKGIKAPLNLYVVHQRENGKHFVRYLDSGDFPLLLTRFESMKDLQAREKELEKYLTEGISEDGYPHRYAPIKNEYVDYQFTMNDPHLRACYTSLQDISGDRIFMEQESERKQAPYVAATLFPNDELYIGSFSYIHQNSAHNLTIEGKTPAEIKGIITYLIENMYLEEARELINRIKSSGKNLDAYKHPRNLVVFDGSDNFLDQKLNEIDALEFVKEKTKHVKLKIFERK